MKHSDQPLSTGTKLQNGGAVKVGPSNLCRAKQFAGLTNGPRTTWQQAPNDSRRLKREERVEQRVEEPPGGEYPVTSKK